MAEMLALMAVLVVGGLLLVLPIIALALAVGSRRRAQRALDRLAQLEWQIARMQEAQRAAATAPAEPAQPEVAAEGVAVAVAPSLASSVQEAQPAEEQPAAPAAIARAAPPAQELAGEEPRTEEPQPEPPPAEALPEGEPAVAAEGAAAVSPEEPQPEPPPAEALPEGEPALAAGAAAASAKEPPLADLPPAGPGAPPPAGAPASIEERIGVVWFTRLGAIIGIVAAAWFYKYMVDNAWIGPWGRVALGAVAGLMLVAWGELLAWRKKAHWVFVQGVLGLGISLLLISAYASFAFYHLVSAMPAFGAVAVIALFSGALAIKHRAQAILVLALLAAFLNPVLLSTGQDRALALFSYLLIMSSGALAVAVRLGFQIATWVTLAGVVALYAGWYARFFDCSPPPQPGLFDRPPQELQGAYFPLLARAVPLVFALVFPVQWVLAGLASARRGGPRPATVALLLTAAVGAHAAYTAVLYDKPVHLGCVLCVLAVLCALLFLREQLSNWLGLPMAASFAVLAGLTGQLERGALLPMMILTGGLSAIYFGVFWRTALKQGQLASPRALLLTGGAGLGMMILSTLWMMPEHFALFGLLLAALSAVYLLLATTVGSVVVLVSAFAASIGGLAAAGLQCEQLDVGFLGVAALWFALYLGFGCYELFVRGALLTPARLAVLAGAGVGFGALFLLGTPRSAELLRAGLSLGTAAVYLLVGLRLRRNADAEDHAIVPLGLALAFLTLALGFLLSGPSITVAWAMEAAVLAFIAARTRRGGEPGHPAWLYGAMVMFSVALTRLLAYDFVWLDKQVTRFYFSNGTEGLFWPKAFSYPLPWALFGLGLALLLSARFTSRVVARPLFRWTAATFVVAGHGALLWLLIGEVRLLMTTMPEFSLAGLPADEFRAVYLKAQEFIADQTTKLQMITTLVMGLYAIVLLGAGFAFRERLHRLLGMLLFGIMLLKLGLFDIWVLETVHKIAVGAAIAVLLMTGGFLYARFAHRIKSLLVDGGKTTACVLALLGVGLTTGAAAAAEVKDYAQRIVLQGVSGPGDYRLEAPVELYAASRAEPRLADVRIFGPDGVEVPFVKRAVRPPPPPAAIPARVLDPVTGPDGRASALIDRGPEEQLHERMQLVIDGEDFLRATSVESSADGKRFSLLAEGAYVFNVGSGGPRAVRTWIAYPTSSLRYLRVTLLPARDGKRLRIVGASLFAPVPTAPAPPTGAVRLKLGGPQRDEEKKVTRYEVGPLPAGVAFTALSFDVPEGEFMRQVSVESSTRKQAWFAAGGGVIYRARRRGWRTPGVDEWLEVPVAPKDRPHLRISVDDGDAQPVALRAVRARYDLEEIVFRARAAGAHELVVGREKDSGARYDLAEMIERAGTDTLRPVRLGALQANPAYAPPTKPERPLPWTERHKGLLQLLIGIAVVGLGLWTLLLMRRGKRAG